MRVRIALIGDENDAYPSHREINAVTSMLGPDVDAEWLPTDGDRVNDLDGFHGIWLTPGSPYADDAAAYRAVKWARERDVPFLGTCGGLQYALIEYFRNVLDAPRASHAESDGIDDTNVVHALACSLHGKERVIRPIAGTRFSRLVNGKPLVGMHYCNYGPGPEELRRLVQGGMVIEATADDAEAEVIELQKNRFFILTLFQPQIGALAASQFIHSWANSSAAHGCRQLLRKASGWKASSRFHQCECLRSDACDRPSRGRGTDQRPRRTSSPRVKSDS